MPKNQKPNDYGYFGKGDNGYVHYKQSFDAQHNRNGSSGGGCFLMIITGILAVLLLVVFVTITAYITQGNALYEAIIAFLIVGLFLWFALKKR